GHALARAVEELLRPDHEVALRARAQHGVVARRRRARERRQWLRDRVPAGRLRGLPAPPAEPARALGLYELAEAPDVGGRRVVVELTERRERPAVRAVEAVAVVHHGVDPAADLLPVDLRHVELSAVRPE